VAKENNLTPWQKGQSGNPAGKPKGTRSRSTIFREFLETESPEGLTYEQKLIKAVYEKCLERGDVSGLKEFMDSAHGKVADKLEAEVRELTHEEWLAQQSKALKDEGIE
jgi:hypothetical protein